MYLPVDSDLAFELGTSSKDLSRVLERDAYLDRICLALGTSKELEKYEPFQHFENTGDDKRVDEDGTW
jgi:hypothetical protein